MKIKVWCNQKLSMTLFLVIQQKSQIISQLSWTWSINWFPTVSSENKPFLQVVRFLSSTWKLQYIDHCVWDVSYCSQIVPITLVQSFILDFSDTMIWLLVSSLTCMVLILSSLQVRSWIFLQTTAFPLFVREERAQSQISKSRRRQTGIHNN